MTTPSAEPHTSSVWIIPKYLDEAVVAGSTAKYNISDKAGRLVCPEVSLLYPPHDDGRSRLVINVREDIAGSVGLVGEGAAYVLLAMVEGQPYLKIVPDRSSPPDQRCQITEGSEVSFELCVLRPVVGLSPRSSAATPHNTARGL